MTRAHDPPQVFAIMRAGGLVGDRPIAGGLMRERPANEFRRVYLCAKHVLSLVDPDCVQLDDLDQVPDAPIMRLPLFYENLYKAR